MSDAPETISPDQGPVDRTGTARLAEQSFASPLTDQECVAYRFEKEVKKKQGRGGTTDPGETRST